MNLKADTKGTWIANFLGRMAESVHQALFRYQVKTGLILCAVEPGEGEGDTVTVDTDIDTGEDNGAAAHDDTGAAEVATDETSGAAATGEEEGEVIVSIGEESPPSDEEEHRAPEWVRELRKSNREKDREIRELRAKLTTTTPAEQAAKVGEKPTLEGCDFDAERFESELDAWKERKRAAEQQESKKREAAEAEQKAWQAKQEAYGKAKADLKVKDFDDAEGEVLGTLNVTQQGVILHGAENPALLVYALGKNPKKAKELASINDPVKFAFAVAKLETQLKVTPKKAAPAPEKTVRGSAPVSGSVDSTLERLRAEAEKTGDLSKVLQYQRQKRSKQ